MKASQALYLLLLGAACTVAYVEWAKADKLQAELDSLKQQTDKIQEDAAARDKSQTDRLKRESQRRNQEKDELASLRAEAAQLRVLQTEVDQLKKQNDQLKSNADTAQLQLQQAAKDAKPETPTDHFPRDSWSFAGYSTPQSALISAIWAMREGKPDVYLNSLAGDEQVRMAKIWQEKDEADIIAKQQNDVSKITGLRVLDQQVVSPTEQILTVYSEGGGRVDQAQMIYVNGEWKFGGFVRKK